MKNNKIKRQRQINYGGIVNIYYDLLRCLIIIEKCYNLRQSINIDQSLYNGRFYRKEYEYMNNVG